MANKALAGFNSSAFAAASKQVLKEQKVLIAALARVQSSAAPAKMPPSKGYKPSVASAKK